MGGGGAGTLARVVREEATATTATLRYKGLASGSPGKMEGAEQSQGCTARVFSLQAPGQTATASLEAALCVGCPLWVPITTVSPLGTQERGQPQCCTGLRGSAGSFQSDLLPGGLLHSQRPGP